MQLDSTNECKACSRILILSSKWMIWYNYSTDAAPTADQSLSGIWSYRSTTNKFAIKLSPLLQSLKINCYSETAEGLPTVQAKMNVAHSRTRHVFVMGSRGKEVSWKQQQSLEESVMLLPVVLENIFPSPHCHHSVFLSLFLAALCMYQGDLWIRVTPPLPTGGLWHMATLPSMPKTRPGR